MCGQLSYEDEGSGVGVKWEGGVFTHQCNEFPTESDKINKGTATVEVDRHGAAPTYRLTLRVRCLAAPGQAFGLCALCVPGLHRLRQSQRGAPFKTTHTLSSATTCDRESKTHTVGTHTA